MKLLEQFEIRSKHLNYVRVKITNTNSDSIFLFKNKPTSFWLDWKINRIDKTNLFEGEKEYIEFISKNYDLVLKKLEKFKKELSLSI